MQTRPPTVEYALTDLGQELIPVIRAIVEVGSGLHLRQVEASEDGGQNLHKAKLAELEHA
jgi:DNA-binding HxlR family transcriptional regulator